MLAAVILETIEGCLGRLCVPGSENKLVWLRLCKKLLDEFKALGSISRDHYAIKGIMIVSTYQA